MTTFVIYLVILVPMVVVGLVLSRLASASTGRARGRSRTGDAGVAGTTGGYVGSSCSSGDSGGSSCGSGDSGGSSCSSGSSCGGGGGCGGGGSS